MSERGPGVPDADATVVLPAPGRRRFGFAPPLERQAAAADLSALGGLNRLVDAANPILAAVPQIRHALRHPDPGGLRARIREQLAGFEPAARAAGVPAPQIPVAAMVLCALLDDSASATPWGREWARSGLLAELHAGAAVDDFFVQLERALAAPAAHVELLEFFYVCLALGFEGRYRNGEGGRQALTQIRSRLFEALQKLRPAPAPELSLRWRPASVPRRRVPGAIALWSVASGCALLLAGLYFAYAISLGSLSDPVARELARLGPLPSFAGEARASPAALGERSRALAGAIGLREVEVAPAGGGIMIVLKADELFASGSARLHARLEPVVLRIAEALDRVPGAVLVTGHTDDVPIRTARFPSNWELSTERARSVVRLMATKMREPRRLRAEGLADSQPLVPNDGAEHRAKNRRVTILLRSAS
ncbi:MAG TPA: type IVB secretion system protein IcmH/DotU [Burkholderiales bacterium]